MKARKDATRTVTNIFMKVTIGDSIFLSGVGTPVFDAHLGRMRNVRAEPEVLKELFNSAPPRCALRAFAHSLRKFSQGLAAALVSSTPLVASGAFLGCRRSHVSSVLCHLIVTSGAVAVKGLLISQ